MGPRPTHTSLLARPGFRPGPSRTPPTRLPSSAPAPYTTLRPVAFPRIVTMLSTLMTTENCPTSAPFFGFMGVTSALVFANIGAGTFLVQSFQFHPPPSVLSGVRGPCEGIPSACQADPHREERRPDSPRPRPPYAPGASRGPADLRRNPSWHHRGGSECFRDAARRARIVADGGQAGGRWRAAPPCPAEFGRNPSCRGRGRCTNSAPRAARTGPAGWQWPGVGSKPYPRGRGRGGGRGGAGRGGAGAGQRTLWTRANLRSTHATRSLPASTPNPRPTLLVHLFARLHLVHRQAAHRANPPTQSCMLLILTALSPPLPRPCSLRHRQVGRRYRVDGCDEAGPRDA